MKAILAPAPREFLGDMHVDVYIATPIVTGWVCHRFGISVADAAGIFDRWCSSIGQGTRRAKYLRALGVRIRAANTVLAFCLWDDAIDASGPISGRKEGQRLYSLAKQPSKRKRPARAGQTNAESKTE